MLAKITKSVVDRLQPGSMVWDTTTVGFGARRQLRHAPLLAPLQNEWPSAFHFYWKAWVALDELPALLASVDDEDRPWRA
jgi:hypothetical protein